MAPLLLAIAVACGDSSIGTGPESRDDLVGLSRVDVRPAFVEVFAGDTLRFTAEAFDLAAHPVAAEFAWQTSGGTIRQSGTYVAAEVGEFAIWAEATTANGRAVAKGHEKRGSARVRVKPPSDGNRAPDVAFSHSCQGLACSFDGSDSRDRDGEAMGFAWQFGDGISGSGRVAEHVYASTGEYHVVLSVTDDTGATASLERTIAVQAAPADSLNQPPSASIQASCLDLRCEFDASASVDPDGSIASYRWDFGDGGTSAEVRTEHSYSAAGPYVVELTVTDGQGASSGAAKAITVTEPNQPPTAAFTHECTDLQCEFDASSSSDEDGIVAAYEWQFGDGTSAAGGIAQHVFPQAGSYTVALLVRDDSGAAGSASRAITVTSTPENPPSTDDPLNTTIYPGENIQAAVDANPAGTEFLIKAGVHRMQSVRPKPWNRFVGEPGAIMSGARLLTEFQRDGGLWVATGQTQENTKRTGYCFDGTDGMNEASPRCNYPEDLFIDDVPLKHVATKGAVGPGSWYFDYPGDRIYFWDDPTGRTVETSVATVAVHGEGATALVFRGLIVEKYANSGQIAAVATMNADDVVIENNIFRLNHAVGVEICCGARGRISGNVITRNGQMGLTSWRGVDLVVEGNEISYNNFAGYRTGWEAGGNKFVETRGLHVINNYSHHNRGKGFWTDGDNVDVLYEGNRIEHNTDYGIFHEVSLAAVIRDNVVIGNGWHGILIDTSADAEVYGNTATGNGTRSVPSGYQYQIWSRNGRMGEVGLYGVWETRNLHVHDNIVSGKYLAGMVGPSQVFSSAYNNRFEGNDYTSTGGLTQPFHWNGSPRDWAGWKSQGNDTTGSFGGI
jgi:parallel beta-helix repeat protein